MITRVLSLGLLCLSASMIYAMDEECTCTMIGDGVDIASKEVSKKEWKTLTEIRAAVFAKMGDDFKKNFKKKHTPRSVAAVKALAYMFDEDWLGSEGVTYWEGIPSKMVIKISGQEYGINAPRSEEIFLDVKRELRQLKNS